MRHRATLACRGSLLLCQSSVSLRPGPWLYLSNVDQRQQSRISTVFDAARPATPELLTIRDLPAPHTGHIRIIGLHSPHNRNAISKQLLAELRAEIKRLEDTDGRYGGVRVMILTSELEQAFCAGADLKERKEMTPKEYVPFVAPARKDYGSTSLSQTRAAEGFTVIFLQSLDALHQLVNNH